jgi:hypothetical protein
MINFRLVPITILSTLILAACPAPCRPIDGNLAISSECINRTSDTGDNPETSTGDTVADVTGHETGNASTTCMDSSTSGPTTGVDEHVFCTDIPSEGEQWGPCIPAENGAPPSLCGDGLVCHTGDIGTLCVAECGANGCVDLPCTGGACTQIGCVPSCESDADCPLGVNCDPALDICVWPFECTPDNPASSHPAGTVWGPCYEDNTCDEKLECQHVADPDAPQGSICAPEMCTVDGSNPVVCPFAEDAINSCGMPIGGPECDAEGECSLRCAGSTDCGAGLECFESRCLWPNG